MTKPDKNPAKNSPIFDVKYQELALSATVHLRRGWIMDQIPLLDWHVKEANSNTCSSFSATHTASWIWAEGTLDASLPHFTDTRVASGETRQGEGSLQVVRRQRHLSQAAVLWKGTTGCYQSQTGPDVPFLVSPQGAVASVDASMTRGLFFSLLLFISHPSMKPSLVIWACGDFHRWHFCLFLNVFKSNPEFSVQKICWLRKTIVSTQCYSYFGCNTVQLFNPNQTSLCFISLQTWRHVKQKQLPDRRFGFIMVGRPPLWQVKVGHDTSIQCDTRHKQRQMNPAGITR